MKKFNEWIDMKEMEEPVSPESELARKGSIGSMAKIDPKYRNLFRRFLSSLPESVDPSQRPHLLTAFILELGYEDVNQAFLDIRTTLRKAVRSQKIDTPLMPPQDGGGLGSSGSGANLG